MNMNNFVSFVDKNLGGKFSGVVTKMKGVMLNYTEMQLKVEEATTNEKWGASSTLMQEIAQETHNIQHFHEIMDMIYKKMQERDANWRQCYKALQLLEYLIKNGSEKVIDNARDHIYELKALLNFKYIDEKSKDQGINVQHRAKEIMSLLDSPDKINQERQKARENKGKYAGFSSDSYRPGGYSSYSSSSTYNNNSSLSSNYTTDASSTISHSQANSTSLSSSGIVSANLGTKSSMNTSTSGTNGSSTTSSNVGNLIDMGGDDDWGDFSSSSQPMNNANNNTFAHFQQPAAVPVSSNQNSGNLIDLL